MRRWASLAEKRRHGRRNTSTTSDWAWLARYSRATETHPRSTAFITGFTLYLVGDVVAQKCIERKTDFSYGRLAGTVCYGATFCGVASYYWYRFLEHLVTCRFGFKAKTLPFVGSKLLIELGLWFPLNIGIFWYVVGMGEGKSLADSTKELHTGFLQAIQGGLCIWTPVDVLNFSLVPVHLQVLVVNVASLIEAVMFSLIHSWNGPSVACESPHITTRQ